MFIILYLRLDCNLLVEFIVFSIQVRMGGWKGGRMSIGGISRDVGAFISNYAVPKVGGKRQSDLDEKNSHQSESLAQGIQKIRNSVREQVLDGRDLNSDGVVSQAEAIRYASKQNPGKLGPEDESSMTNRILDQVLKGLDVNGDGIVSQTEAIKNATKYNIVASLYQDNDDIEKGKGFGLGGDGNHLSILA
jgi:hypothetical protein